MTQIEREDGLIAIDTDELHIIHRRGDSEYPELRHTVVRADQAGQWEELTVEAAEAARAAVEREEAYTAEVERLISEHYSMSNELAIMRQRDTKPEEFAAYDAYAEACKARARAMMSE